MSVIGILLPFIILVFIIALVFLTVFFGKKYTGSKLTKLLLGTYFIILVVAVIVYYCLPNSTIDSVESPNMSFEQIHQAIEQETFENVEAIKEKERWNIPFDQAQLNIQYLDNINMYTIFDQKENDDQTIEIIYYVANTQFNGYDFYDEIPTPTISIQGNSLIANPAMENEVKLHSFHNDFVISQFRGGGITDEFDERFNDDKPLNYDFLIIRVPKNLELTGSEFVNFLGEQ
ncbi:hypothetical protein DZB84_24050 [Bacillus sp. HNG]|uniref:hypothetical protein n=1 Tax=Bacillus sp. HNG TaxID=2293325 RepID=UPI000E2FB575|nr:hypothetical protein [Bacillus sp. HNG]RFB09640.1 hypothetical protein DZB84_24050 [Bacillus sp. HNG]